jgi:hypothetical protein
MMLGKLIRKNLRIFLNNVAVVPKVYMMRRRAIRIERNRAKITF